MYYFMFHVPPMNKLLIWKQSGNWAMTQKFNILHHVLRKHAEKQ